VKSVFESGQVPRRWLPAEHALWEVKCVTNFLVFYYARLKISGRIYHLFFKLSKTCKNATVFPDIYASDT